MKLYTEQDKESVLVPASFIDSYMAAANGEFVKVYLYLLRHLGSRTDFSLASAADMLECTENDIRRAVQYWKKQGLLRITENESGEWTELYVADISPVQAGAENREKASGTDRTDDASVKSVSHTVRGTQKEEQSRQAGNSSTQNLGPAPEGLPKARVEELAAQEEVRQLFYVAGQYMGRPLSSTEQEDLLYYYDVLHFPADLIEYLLEYCISKGSASRHYIRKVALEWYKAGVKNRAEAKKESSLFNKDFFAIMKAFGLKGRYPAAQEQELMTHWISGLGFSMELILEACSRTILQTHEASFPYTNSILEEWKKKEVHTLADVKALDAAHHARVKEADRKAQSAGNARREQAQANATRFHNFNQREYDYDSLERQLLQAK